MNIWTYRRPFVLHGQSFRIEAGVGLSTVTTRLLHEDRVLATDTLQIMDAFDQQRLQVLHGNCNGEEFAVEVGYVNLWSMGIRVLERGELVHESHTGLRPRPIAAFMPGASAGALPPVPDAADRIRHRSGESRWERPDSEQRADRAAQQWNRNKYSFFTDIGLGVLFLLAAKLTDSLSTAALIAAGAGLAVVVAQRFVKVDLLGGLALFGVGMLLLSAGFSIAFDDDFMVKMKSTILGLFVAALMGVDGLLNRGGYFGRRLGRYLPMPTDPRRLAMGMAALGLVTALLNYAVAIYFSTDVWLWYTSFGDFIITLVLMFQVLRYARPTLGALDA
jgi:intracellular septation protein A